LNGTGHIHVEAIGEGWEPIALKPFTDPDTGLEVSGPHVIPYEGELAAVGRPCVLVAPVRHAFEGATIGLDLEISAVLGVAALEKDLPAVR
jgi:hypothetical protein